MGHRRAPPCRELLAEAARAAAIPDARRGARMTTQTAFRRGLLDPAQARPRGAKPPRRPRRANASTFYRNNVAASLMPRWKPAFPPSAALSGRSSSRPWPVSSPAAARPRISRLATWGGKFPGFLARFDPVAHLPLPARRGAARPRAAAIPTTPPTPPPSRPRGWTPPPRHGAAPAFWRPPPSCLPRCFPVFGIWRYNSVANAEKPSPGPEDVLIARPRFDPRAAPVATRRPALRARAQGPPHAGRGADPAPWPTRPRRTRPRS